MRLIILALLAAPLASGAQSLRVVSTEPGLHQVGAATTTHVAVVFGERIDSGSIDARSFQVFGRWSGVATGAIHQNSTGTAILLVPDQPFSAGERVTVTLSHRIRASDGDSLEAGYAFQFWVASQPATMAFRELDRIEVRNSREGWIQTYGAYAGDLNGDGWSDLAVFNERSNDARIFMNDGAGGYSSFTQHSLVAGNRPSPNEGVDLDLDGDIDIIAGNAGGTEVSVLMNNGAGVFSDAPSLFSGSAVRGVTVLDFDADGLPDLATANRGGVGNGNVALFRGLGNGRFEPARILDTGASQETAIEATDLNNDGIMDLVVGALGSEDIVGLIGNGTGGFVVGPRFPTGGATWMIATGDINGDGFVDVASANSNRSAAAVLMGDGRGGFGDPELLPTGAFPLAIDLGDLDGDGALDLVSSEFAGVSWTVYRNNGAGSFGPRMTIRASAAGSCAILHDRDNNGTLDLTLIDERDDLIFIFENPAAGPTPVEPPIGFDLLGAYPNPFESVLRFTRELDEVTVLDILGRRITTLSSATSWNGRSSAGVPVPPGIYVIRAGAWTELVVRR